MVRTGIIEKSMASFGNFLLMYSYQQIQSELTVNDSRSFKMKRILEIQCSFDGSIVWFLPPLD